MTLLVAPLVLLWPAAAVAVLLDGRRRAVGWAAAGVLAGALALLVALAVRVARDGPVEVVAGGWPASVGIQLRADALGVVLALVSVAVLLAAQVHGTLHGIASRLFPALMLFLGVGLTGLFLTGDVFNFYVFFELAMISAYALSAIGGQRRSIGSALIFAVVNLLGSVLFLVAVATLYRAVGTLEMTEVAARAAQIDPNTAVVVAVLFFVAFGVKLGLFPFHFWLPGVYAGAPPAVAAVLAGALANIGAYGLLRFEAGLLSRELSYAGGALIAIGTVSIIYGAVQAIGRRDAREVLAYSAIGHAGYVLVALGVGGTVAFTAAVLFTVVNALGKALLFLAVDLRGPLMGAAFAVGAFSVAGVPPAAGFFGKAALFEAGVEAGSAATVVLLFVGGALTFVYLFQIYQHVYWRPQPEQRPSPAAARAVVAVLAALVLVLGLWPEPLLALSEQAGDVLAGGLLSEGVAVTRALAVVLVAAVYLLVLGSVEPWDVAAGLLLGTVLVLALRRRPCAPADPGGPFLPRLVALPALVGSVLVEVAAGTWDVGLRVLHLRPLDAPGIVLVPVGERSPLGVAVTGLLVGLSPGSVLLEVDRDRDVMLFHVIDARDPDGVRARIERSYQRYQRKVWP